MNCREKKPNFIYDVEKMYDIFSIKKEDFLSLYSYLSNEEYDNTVFTLLINTIINWDDYVNFMCYIGKKNLVDKYVKDKANGVYD